MFRKPADAIRCANDASEGVRELGLEIRAGIHLGEAEVMGPKLGGLAVNTGARIMSVGKAGEVLVSATVKDAVAGKEIEFADHGVHELKGLDGEFRLYDVISVDGAARRLPLDGAEARARRDRPPTAAGSRRRWWLVAAGVAVLAIAPIAYVASDSVDEPEGHASASTGGRAPTDADEQVIAIVPESFSGSCVPTDPLPRDAVGSVTCTQDEHAVTYATYATRDDLVRAFGANTAGLELAGTSCRDDPEANGFYTVDGTQRGAVACFVEHPTPLEFVPTIVWTDEPMLVLGRATTEVVTDYEGNVADRSFYDWWRTSTGRGRTGISARRTIPRTC